MSDRLADLFDPASQRARLVRIGRGRFAIEAFSAAVLPSVLSAATVMIVASISAGVELPGRLILAAFGGALIGMPSAMYASLRLNAAALARLRDMGIDPVIHPAFGAPLPLGRNIVAGSSRSIWIAGLPVTLVMIALVSAVGQVLVAHGPSLAFAALPGSLFLVIALVQAAFLVPLFGRSARQTNTLEVTQ